MASTNESTLSQILNYDSPYGLTDAASQTRFIPKPSIRLRIGYPTSYDLHVTSPRYYTPKEAQALLENECVEWLYDLKTFPAQEEVKTLQLSYSDVVLGMGRELGEEIRVLIR
jgi:hypothetical protein